MLSFDPKELDLRQNHQLLIGGVGPRPIALVSTISSSGIHNLAPFSFFNAVGSNPPMLVFSASHGSAQRPEKDTTVNLRATGECVVQVVTHSIIEKVNQASAEYPPEVDEFAAVGLTPIKSELVKPARVKESPFQMECRLQQLIALGNQRGAGNLAICEVLRFHVDESILVNGIIDPNRIDLIGRLGGDTYSRASGQSLFDLPKPK